MAGQAKISIVVPVYNVSQYLPRCLDSILAQTYTNLQIILINDGSTDNSGAICDIYAAKDSRIQVIHQANAGVSTARNVGIDIASGHWIGFVDSDDWAEPDMFEQLLNAVIRHKVKLSICGFTKYHINNKVEVRVNNIPTILTRDVALLHILSERYYEGFLWNKLFHHSLLKGPNAKRQDANLHFCEDLVLTTSILTKLSQVAYVKKPLYHYIMRQGNACTSVDRRRLTELDARSQVINIAAGISKAHHKLAKVYYAKSAMYLRYQAARQKDKKNTRLFKNAAFKHGISFILSMETSVKIKLWGLAVLFVPRLFAVAWGIIKK